MFENVAKEPGSYNHHKKCREGYYLLPLFLLLLISYIPYLVHNQYKFHYGKGHLYVSSVPGQRPTIGRS